ncbi:type I-C CRISPR-associated protein Cas5c [Rhodopirellula sp. MGV]|uniref:type I-C CRISPR-associated protein Cas5c n=1 Tax=Rhodopirellula sp. MGV TaxID=2023130 RepID=UPI000B97C6DB|nr:type I-C CRISPR-associated protein Cas5c [Rhodopirellula sp. MGV]OYP35552.1 type I-C CRISPR-associated protein Cas5 [Rhodopirellula sp. MGV]PNY34589.1 type I-C CRISPR-associated protein Cas5 [Rhodopirellula baltica]
MFGFKVLASGPLALFSRPETRVERDSYDCITPSAARALYESVYWKPEIAWRIRRIHLINPIRKISMRRNELSSKIAERTASTARANGGPLATFIESDRQQRAAMYLRDVCFGIEADFDVVSGDDGAGKHASMFERRIKKGQRFQSPYLGTRECTADLQLVDEFPESAYASIPEHDFGMMLHDIDYSNNNTPHFFHAVMKHGVIEVPDFEPVESQCKQSRRAS